MNFNLSKKILEELATWLFLQDAQASDSFELYQGIDFNELPQLLKFNLLKELNAEKSDFGEIVLHDIIGNVPMHEDEEFFEQMEASYTVLIPIKTINQGVYSNEEKYTFIHNFDNQYLFSNLEVGKHYKFHAYKEHGIMSQNRIMTLVLWVLKK